MSKFNYPKSQATADRLLKKFGQNGQIVRDVQAGGDPWNPTDPTTETYPCTLAVLVYDDKDIDGTLIKATDKKIYMSSKGLAIEPTTTDKIVIGGASHTIVKVKPLNPAGLVVFYEAQVRR
ncbi:hypothetical protein C5748_18385 [Phyllobacterium phragmitis]|uniref:Uncharacterized protein n=1 Tax=Phyllobacterium phragmitis TaxID=2670329 RepID=A0A2S9INM3_9HYPH|nr:hypothetical protein [Phyllobacterium phragmitis]PRD42118.1 hypothetical protein C5748_18385 [Phyllobacterium phragmitis]